MTALLVSPFLLTAPDETTASDEIANWWKAALPWLLELQETDIDWLQVVGCTEALFSAETFISFSKLKKLEATHRVGINPGLITRISRQLQSGEKDYKTKLATEDVLGRTEIAVDPAEFIDRIASGCRGIFSVALMSIVADRAANIDYAKDICLVDLPYFPACNSVTIECDIEILVPDEVFDALPSALVADSVPLFTSPEDLSNLDPRAIASLGEREFLRHLVRAAKKAYGGNVLECSFHSEFFPSVQASGILTNLSGLNTLVRRCEEVLADNVVAVAGARLRPFRESPAPGSKQKIRIRDGAHAWRVTITTGGVGWRMNYWKVPPKHPGETELIELAWIQHETDRPYIPD